MRLRPHHLLCTQSYSGKGYDAAFVDNMNQITRRLRTEKSTPVEVVFSDDDLCACCPNRLENGFCKDNEKVISYDKKVIQYFHIEEKTYIYQELAREIREKMTPEMLASICGDCEWYPISACRRVLCGEAVLQDRLME